MIKTIYLLTSLIILMNSCQNQEVVDKKKIIIFTKTAEFRHASITAGVEVVTDISKKLGYEVVHTENSAIFNANQLSQVEAIVFLNTTGEILNNQQKEALVNYMVMGGNFMGIHSAANTEMNWGWYANHIGGIYDMEIGELDEYIISIVNDSLGINKKISGYSVNNEKLFPFTNLNKDIYVLIEGAFCPNDEGTNNIESMPLAWIKKSENGKVFYTSLGHTSETFKSPFFRNHLTSGMKYLLTGDKTYIRS